MTNGGNPLGVQVGRGRRFESVRGLAENPANEHVGHLATLAEEPTQYWSAQAALPWN
jgi:hypothetical protein